MPVSCLIPTKYWYNYIQSSILNSMMNAWAQPFKLGWLNIWVNLNHRIAAGDVVEPDMSSPVARATGCSKGLFWMGYYKVDAFCWKFDEPNAIFTCLKQSEKAEMASSWVFSAWVACYCHLLFGIFRQSWMKDQNWVPSSRLPQFSDCLNITKQTVPFCALNVW